MHHSDDELLPSPAYDNLDLLYDIKTYGDVRSAITCSSFQGLLLNKRDVKNILKIIHDCHLEI